MANNSIPFTDHVVILGWDALAHRITRQLLLADRQVAVITRQTEVRDVIQDAFSPEDVQVHLSNLNDWATFDRVNIEDSLKVFVNLDDEQESLVAILNMQARYEDLEFDVVLSNPELEDTFYTAGVTYAVSVQNLASKLTASHLFEPEVATYTSDLLSAGDEPGGHDIQEYELTESNEYVGQPWHDLFWDVKDELNCVPIGLGRANPDAPGREVTKIPEDETTLQAGDYVVLIMAAEKEKALERFFGTSEGLAHA